MLNLEVTDRDGETIDELAYEAIEELLADWPYAERTEEGAYSAWVGGRKQYV